MSGIGRFAVVNSKVRVLESKFLDKSQIEQLLLSKSFTEALNLLNENKKYSRALKGYRVEELHRGQLEIILKRDFIKNFDKFQHYFNGYYRKLLKILFIKYEIQDIKVIMRGKYIKRSQTEVNSVVTFQSDLSSIDYEALIKAPDIETAVDKMKETVYYDYIVHFAKAIKSEGFFRFEARLDSVYYTELSKFTKSLDKVDRLILEEVSGIEIDLINLEWIFRAKEYYKLSPEETLANTIYEGHGIKKDRLKELSYANSLSEFYDMLKGLPYEHIFSSVEGHEYLMGKEILSYLKKVYMKYKSEYKMNISVLLAFLELSYMELTDVITIVENKRYSIEYEESIKYITAFDRL